MLKIFSPLSQFDIFGLIFFFFGKTTFVITNLGITIFVIILIGILFFYIFYKKRNKFINKNYQIFFESIFIFVYKVVYEQIGKDGLIYFPFIFSLFVFILLLNLFSIIPMSFAVTSHLI
jgi:F0F1-type ATP synthase membrane subunit a